MNATDFGQFSRFLTVGVSNTLLSLTVIYLAKWVFHANDLMANVSGYSLGICLSFYLNSNWTFAYGGGQWAAFRKFLLVALLAYGMNLAVVFTAIYVLGVNSYLAQSLGIPAYTLTSYFLNKHFVFGTRRSSMSGL